jgi:glutamyl-tRNA synthetase
MDRSASGQTRDYRGRIAPSPTGYLHLGHARTFWTAQERARSRNGTLILRNEDIDRARCKPEYVAAMTADLRWFGFKWQEGPDIGGPHAPYDQSERYPLYREALDRLKADGFAYPCTCSRKDIQAAASAPQGADDEAIYPGTCRDLPNTEHGMRKTGNGIPNTEYRTGKTEHGTSNAKVSWRFRVPDGGVVEFEDGRLGRQQFTAGSDFGDFVLWRNDDVPAYQLAVVVDDASMGITEVVRGEDLLVSTARQLLLYRALQLEPPRFYHCELMADENGMRLAKRTEALSLRALRDGGELPQAIRARW